MTSTLVNEKNSGTVVTKEQTTPPLRKAKSPLIPLILVLIALALTLYNYALNQQEQRSTQMELAKLKEALSETKAGTSQLSSELTKLAGQQLQQQEAVNALREESQKIASQPDLKAWPLLKARYCLELARLNAHWTQDNKTTIALLNQADKLLQPNPTTAISKLRTALAKSLVELQEQEPIDKIALLSQLSALSDRIAGLNLTNPLAQNQSTESTNKQQLSLSEHFRQSIKKLEKLIIIQKHDEKDFALLNPLQQNLLKDLIRFNLQEAEWAVLETNQALYQWSLSEALKNLNHYFKEEPKVAFISNSLQQLQMKSLSYREPKLDSLIDDLNAFIAEGKEPRIKEAA